MEINFTKGKAARNFISDDELKQKYPALWRAVHEKIGRINTTWTPEVRAALQKQRERPPRSL